mmetsp:Transcript_28113/g.65304  ORF Transcript_28113/g.65304 Transcript_28113/m.65304 type:complete len:209 (-) Transcript_28113:456-1082(-)
MKDSSNTFLLLLLPLGLVTAAGHSMQLASPTYQEAVAMEIVNVGMELSEYYVLLKGETHIESFIRQAKELYRMARCKRAKAGLKKSNLVHYLEVEERSRATGGEIQARGGDRQNTSQIVDSGGREPGHNGRSVDHAHITALLLASTKPNQGRGPAHVPHRRQSEYCGPLVNQYGVRNTHPRGRRGRRRPDLARGATSEKGLARPHTHS